MACAHSDAARRNDPAASAAAAAAVEHVHLSVVAGRIDQAQERQPRCASVVAPGLGRLVIRPPRPRCAARACCGLRARIRCQAPRRLSDELRGERGVKRVASGSAGRAAWAIASLRAARGRSRPHARRPPPGRSRCDVSHRRLREVAVGSGRSAARSGPADGPARDGEHGAHAPGPLTSSSCQTRVDDLVEESGRARAPGQPALCRDQLLRQSTGCRAEPSFSRGHETPGSGVHQSPLLGQRPICSARQSAQVARRSTRRFASIEPSTSGRAGWPRGGSRRGGSRSRAHGQATTWRAQIWPISSRVPGSLCSRSSTTRHNWPVPPSRDERPEQSSRAPERRVGVVRSARARRSRRQELRVGAPGPASAGRCRERRCRRPTTPPLDRRACRGSRRGRRERAVGNADQRLDARGTTDDELADIRTPGNQLVHEPRHAHARVRPAYDHAGRLTLGGTL